MGAVRGRDGFWVFGYGSLMWRPGFDYLERRPARLEGWKRAFRLRSIRYRGTPEAPGLVLGLDHEPGASCIGMAFRVCPTRAPETRAYLAEREMMNRSYFEIEQGIRLMPEPGEDVHALTYVIDRAHPQYAGAMSLEEQAAIIACSAGPAGPNAEYLFNTAEALASLGVTDPEIETLARMVQAHLATPPG